MAGRYIVEFICLISDILEYVEENELSGILFSADFEKAFDSIEHPYIFAALQLFGFGLEFIQWVRTFLKGIESCVLNNGHSTGYFHWKEEPGKGIHCLHIFSSFVWKHCLFKFVIMIILGESVLVVMKSSHLPMQMMQMMQIS